MSVQRQQNQQPLHIRSVVQFRMICFNVSLCYRFDIFSFLVQFVHRDGMIGEQARDSLLLCMSISKNNDKIAEYITSKSNICPVREYYILNLKSEKIQEF